jgi:hypothetical protein
MPKSKSTPLIVEDELNALKEENAKLKTELAACQAKLIEAERLCAREVTWEASGAEAKAERQLAKYVADFANKSEVTTVKARNYSKAMAITQAQEATIHYNEIYDRRNMDASAPQRMAAMLAGDKAIFIAAATAMNLVEPQLKAEAHEGVEWQRLQFYLLRSIKWCDDTIASAANGTYDPTKTPPKFYDL